MLQLVFGCVRRSPLGHGRCLHFTCRKPALNHPKPPPQTRQPDDERKIQIFLERASSIVLERPVLDLMNWRRLVLLAEELGLSDEELRSTVNDLRHRGVISEIDVSPPKPPPLPSQQGKPTPEATPQSGPEQDFSLTPPVPPPPPSNGSPQPSTRTNSGNGAPPLVPAKQGAVERTDRSPADTTAIEERLRRYAERAQAIIAEQRGFGGRTQALLAAAADELGLSDQEAAGALQSLGRAHDSPPAPPSAPNRNRDTKSTSDTVSADELRDSRRWRVEGAPPPEPPPPTRKPEVIYREYISASMAQITDGVVPVLLERKFVKHGTSVLGLAQTFARHLVHEEAAEKGLRFASKQTDADAEASGTTSPDDNGLCDANVKLFLERSVPILAQHRGINAKSRVLLNAIAAELGLAEEQVERAIAATQFRSTTSREEADALQQERLVKFRELVQGALISLPRKLLTFDVQENLQRHGEERHGIKPDLVANAVREICVALDIRQISEQQSREHIERLVDTKLGEDACLPNEVRARIESEGKQWGLNAGQIAAIINERTRLRDKRNRSERNFTHGALLAAGVAALMVAGFFGWVALRQKPPEPLPPGATIEQLRMPAPIVVDETSVDTAWWGEELEFAISAARREMGSLRPVLIQVEAKESSKRRAAYGHLVNELFAKEHGDEQRDLLVRVISLSYAREPDQQAARQLLDSVTARIPGSEHDLRGDDSLYPRAFLATRAAVAMVTQASEERRRDASAELGRSLGRSIDAGLEPTTLQQHAYEGLAERLYRVLLALAKSDPARVASVHALVEKQSAAHLDGAKLEKLNTDFLVVVLTGASHTWRDYVPLIRGAVAAKNPLNALHMLEVYEKTTDEELQAFLAEALIERLGTPPESRDVATIAGAVRKSLGVTSEEVDNKRLTRLLVGANSLLDESRAGIGEPESLLVEIVNLAYNSTLGCAAAQGSAGDAAFDTLAEQDPAAFLTVDKPARPVTENESETLEPTTIRILNERLTMLLNPRNNSSVSRLGFVETIAGFADRVDDLAPDQASALATYLLGKKRVEEHRAILPHVEEIGKWKQVRLAVADQLDEDGVSREQLQEIVSKLLGREYKVGRDAAGLEALRVELLRDALMDAKSEDVGEQDEYQVYDEAARALYDLYKTQANLLRTADWPETPATPTVVARAMIESRVKQLLASKLPAEAQKQVRQIEVDSRAIDYLAANDLQRLALLDRAWLRLLAAEFAHRHPARKPETDVLVEQLAARDRDAKHVLIQLRDGQEIILRMWLLLNRTD